MSVRGNTELRQLALSVLQPGFVGTTPPDWLLRAVQDGLGSVVLFSRNILSIEQVARLTERLRAENPDLIVAIDEESGDVTRIESATGSSRPGNFALGYVDDPELTSSVAADLGRQLRAAGVSLNYGPSVDVNSNPDNPIIGVRSFGVDPKVVCRHAGAWVRGLQSSGVAACAKHFPGHGDVAVDSHHGLPVYDTTREELEAQALPPFRAALDAGARAVMSAHLLVPACDPAVPATLSSRILGDLLRGELGFDGLIITDAIEMGAVADRYGVTGAAVAAVTAGADAICVGGENADEGIATGIVDALAQAVLAGDLPVERLTDAARRVREFAAWSSRLAPAASDGSVPDGSVGLSAARRAIRVRGATHGVLPVSASPHVVELSPATNLAIGKETPWGVAASLLQHIPSATSVRLGQENLDPPAATADLCGLDGARGRPLVVVVRDAARHRWMTHALEEITGARPDAIVVEMGLPGQRWGATTLDTHGASTASGAAVAELLAGAPARP
ncbi:glycoside hydrolase family 3 protein [Streptomyces sp. NBC_00525]|uniref:glycoside hydrolase family 3 protein n=1 Tax=Streptomyces sp. NBC_00525 TaxID=2903660 RepID=UPI002E80BD2F|nr:glycoside hydrolase family 3 N-terminal domain-containing protein [Streptomyces sp. NBC_00525]WUC94192.1 glycoside hydrolase family 3 protein [Streptomyces sp. NBC_00525]